MMDEARLDWPPGGMVPWLIVVTVACAAIYYTATVIHKRGRKRKQRPCHNVPQELWCKECVSSTSKRACLGPHVPIPIINDAARDTNIHVRADLLPASRPRRNPRRFEPPDQLREQAIGSRKSTPESKPPTVIQRTIESLQVSRALRRREKLTISDLLTEASSR